MADKDLFDVSKLTEQEIGEFEWVVNSPSFLRVFRPYLITMRDSVQTMMLDRSEDRKRMYPDDFLAGEAAALIGFVKFLDGLKANTSMERMHKAVQLSTEQMYADLRNRGVIAHSGQHLSPEDLAAAEDF
jgi:hypothetical protein